MFSKLIPLERPPATICNQNHPLKWHLQPGLTYCYLKKYAVFFEFFNKYAPEGATLAVTCSNPALNINIPFNFTSNQ
jgi:hypothetical protein